MLKAQGLGELCSTVRLIMGTFSLHTGWQTISIGGSMMKLQTSCKSAQSWKGKLCTAEVMKTLVIINKEQKPQARTHLLACFQHSDPIAFAGQKGSAPTFFCFAQPFPLPQTEWAVSKTTFTTKLSSICLPCSWAGDRPGNTRAPASDVLGQPDRDSSTQGSFSYLQMKTHLLELLCPGQSCQGRQTPFSG